MKRTRFLTIINTAPVSVSVLANVVNALRLNGEEPDKWQLLVPYGEYPAVANVGGKPTPIIQVVDRVAGEAMAENIGTVINTIRHLGRGLPIYVGHPDDEGWLKTNPGADASSKGRIKQLEAREDGVYFLSAFNEEGRELIGGDAPKYSAHSPNWDLVPIEEGSKRFRPFVLRSIGLTNTPNIPACVIGLNTAGAVNPSPTEAAGAVEETENQNDQMKLTPEALKALGFAADANPTPEEISAAIVKLESDKATADAAKATAESSVTAANTRAATAETDLGNLRATLTASAINSAIQEGRISEAERGTWEGLLKADLVNGSAALSKARTSAINTVNHIPDLKTPGVLPASGGKITAINSAVAAFAKENGLNLEVKAQYDQAFAAVKAAKPDLFGN